MSVSKGARRDKGASAPFAESAAMDAAHRLDHALHGTRAAMATVHVDHATITVSLTAQQARDLARHIEGGPT